MNAPPPSVLPPPGDPRTLYVVDLSGYVFRAYHALPPLSAPSGEHTHAVLGTTTMLQKLAADRRPALFAVAMDSRAPSFRHARYDGYKANRPPAPPDLRSQLDRVSQVIDAYRFAVLQQDGVEADDLIASVTKLARGLGLSVVIVSSDKDLMQLVGDGVWMLDSMRNATFGPPEVEAKLGVPPSRVRDYLALVGDTSDNIPGVPSVGPKTAVQLLADHGSLAGIYAAIDKIEKKALKQRLIDHRADAELSYELVGLKDDLAIDAGIDKLTVPEPDRERLAQLFQELDFGRLLTALNAPPKPAAAASGKPSASASTGQMALSIGGEAQPVPLPAAPAASSSAAPHAPTPTQTSLLDAAPDQPPSEPVEVVLTKDALAALVASLEKADALTIFCVTEGDHPVSGTLVGVCLAASERASYVPIAHRYLGSPEQLTEADVLDALRPMLQADKPAKVCADAKVERMVLSAHGAPLQGVVFDAMLASYLIDPERHTHRLSDIARFELDAALSDEGKRVLERRATVGSISELRVEAAAEAAGELARTTLRARTQLEPRLQQVGCEPLLREIELPLSRVLAQMELTGVRVDTAHLAKLSEEVQRQLVGLDARCRELAGHDFNVGSPRQLETILFDELKLPVIKRTKTARSTDHEVLEELAPMHPLPEAILEQRMLAKLDGTYLQALPREINPRTGRIHTDFRQAVAATGRLSSQDPNLQNIPIRTELGRSIRDAFIAREGWQILSADYSQIELRVLAHLSHDPALVDAFSGDADVHSRTASAIFGIEEAAVTREQRGQAKTVNYAVIYGQTQFALARNLRIARSDAARYIKAFFEQYAGVARYMETIVAEAAQTGEVRTLCGRIRKLPDLRSPNRVQRAAAERVARNTPIQGSAADIIKLAMIGIADGIEKAGLQSKMLLSVHDELVFEAPPEEKDMLEKLVRERMEHVIKLDVPLVVDQGWGASWGAAH